MYHIMKRFLRGEDADELKREIDEYYRGRKCLVARRGSNGKMELIEYDPFENCKDQVEKFRIDIESLLFED